MQKATVAGEIIGITLLGYSLKDLSQSVGIPIGVLIVFEFLPFESGYVLPASILGITLGILILYLKPDSHTPFSYIKSGLVYYLTPSTYHINYGREETEVDYQDTVVTAFNSEEDKPEKYRK